MVDFLTAITLTVDVIGTILLATCLATQRFDNYPPLFKVALAIMTLGLLGQVGKQAMVLIDGPTAADRHFPWWMLKDWGIALFGIALTWRPSRSCLVRLIQRKLMRRPSVQGDSHAAD